MNVTRENFSRIEKLLFDSEDVESPEHAKEVLARFKLSVIVGKEYLHSPQHQLTLLTLCNLASRAFPGGVYVEGIESDAPLLVNVMSSGSLKQALGMIGGVHLSSADNVPLIHIGSTSASRRHECNLRCTFENWSGCVSPVSNDLRLNEDNLCPLASILAAGLSIAEAFQYRRAELKHKWTNIEAGYRIQGLSLWDPSIIDGWEYVKGPRLMDLPLPDAYWLLGLGHLGQAYAWGLSSVPFVNRSAVRIVLNDVEELTESNVSTSVLTTIGSIGIKKTRVVAAYLERIGFQTEIIERRFDGVFRISDADPHILLCGVDNLDTRRMLESPGFKLAIDAGLGGTATDYLQLSVRRFPSRVSAKSVYALGSIADANQALYRTEQYRRLETRVGTCGLERIAGAAVGVPFTGAVASSIVLSWAVRAHTEAAPVHYLGISLDGTLYRKTAC